MQKEIAEYSLLGPWSKCPGNTFNDLSMRHFRESNPNQERTESGAKNLGCNVKARYTRSVYHSGIVVHCGIYQNHPASGDFSFCSLD